MRRLVGRTNRHIRAQCLLLFSSTSRNIPRSEFTHISTEYCLSIAFWADTREQPILGVVSFSLIKSLMNPLPRSVSRIKTAVHGTCAVAQEVAQKVAQIVPPNLVNLFSHMKYNPMRQLQVSVPIMSQESLTKLRNLDQMRAQIALNPQTRRTIEIKDILPGDVICIGRRWIRVCFGERRMNMQSDRLHYIRGTDLKDQSHCAALFDRNVCEDIGMYWSRGQAEAAHLIPLSELDDEDPPDFMDDQCFRIVGVFFAQPRLHAT